VSARATFDPQHFLTSQQAHKPRDHSEDKRHDKPSQDLPKQISPHQKLFEGDPGLINIFQKDSSKDKPPKQSATQSTPIRSSNHK
jgi:hypothetical protein